MWTQKGGYNGHFPHKMGIILEISNKVCLMGVPVECSPLPIKKQNFRRYASTIIIQCTSRAWARAQGIRSPRSTHTFFLLFPFTFFTPKVVKDFYLLQRVIVGARHNFLSIQIVANSLNNIRGAVQSFCGIRYL